MCAVAAACISPALVCTLVLKPRPLLVWNASPSSPRGLYEISKARRVRPGDTILAWAPRSARILAGERHYLPAGIPLVKRVSAVSGDHVCASGPRIVINGRIAALRRRADPAGRALPRWTGCRRLADGELLLLSEHSPLAFDGRYFGVTRAAEVIGKARLIWAG